jgi:hypothetical protein
VWISTESVNDSLMILSKLGEGIKQFFVWLVYRLRVWGRKQKHEKIKTKPIKACILTSLHSSASCWNFMTESAWSTLSSECSNGWCDDFVLIASRKVRAARCSSLPYKAMLAVAGLVFPHIHAQMRI